MGACEEKIIAFFREKSINPKVDLIASNILKCGVQSLMGLSPLMTQNPIASCRSAGS
jgi:hypothetical protein